MISIANATGTIPLNSFLGATVFGMALVTIIIVLAIWSFIWKGIALWQAAKNHSKTWFIILLILNTVGILDIIYIFIISKRKHRKKESSPKEDTENNKDN